MEPLHRPCSKIHPLHQESVVVVHHPNIRISRGILLPNRLRHHKILRRDWKPTREISPHNIHTDLVSFHSSLGNVPCFHDKWSGTGWRT